MPAGGTILGLKWSLSVYLSLYLKSEDMTSHNPQEILGLIDEAAWLLRNSIINDIVLTLDIV